MDSKEVIGHCTSEVDSVSQDPLDYKTQDVVLIFPNEEYKMAECILRRDLLELFNRSEIYIWDRVYQQHLEDRLVKLPYQGSWVLNADVIFRNKNRSTFVLKNPVPVRIGSYSPSESSSLHGVTETVRTVELADDRIQLIADIERSEHEPREELGDILESKAIEEEEEKKEVEEDYIIDGNQPDIDLSDHYSFRILIKNNGSLGSLRLHPDTGMVWFLDCPFREIPIITGGEIFLGFKNCDFRRVNNLPAIAPEVVFNSCRYLDSVVNMPPTVEELSFKNCPLLNRFTLSEQVDLLTIVDCPSIRNLPLLRDTALTDLQCKKCPSLRTLPDLPNTLKSLKCVECPISLLPGLPDGMVKLMIASCPIESLDDLPDSITTLKCSSCPELQNIIALPRSLKVLTLDNCPKLSLISPVPESIEFSCVECPIEVVRVPGR